MAKTSDLTGKRVAITGGARGIGRATAESFLNAGAHVVIGDIDRASVEKTSIDLAGAHGDEAVHGLPLDVTSRESFGSFLDRAEQAVGPLDVLVNNAGIMPISAFLDEDEAMTDRQLDINLRGVLNGSRLAGQRFRERGSGHVVNIASLAGFTGTPGVATYSATKFAVVGLSQALFTEWQESGVHMTVVLPGIVRTELSAGMDVPKWLQSFCTVDPEDIAEAIVRAVAHPRFFVTVPKRLKHFMAGGQLLPESVQLWLTRRTNFDKMMLDADPRARAEYEKRIAGN